MVEAQILRLYFFIFDSRHRRFPHIIMKVIADTMGHRTFLLIIIFTSVYFIGLAQSPSAITGDWILTDVMYSDGSQLLPADRETRTLKRYYFINNKVFVVLGNTTFPMDYTRAGNELRLGPVQTFTIEQYSDKALILLEVKKDRKAERYFFIPVDSFTVSDIWKYQHTTLNTDTVYTTAPGISPIYLLEDKMTFMDFVSQGLGYFSPPLEFSFVVKKDGTIGAVEILSTSSEKLKSRLTKVIMKTSGKWVPGAIKGKPVNVKITEEFIKVDFK